MRPPPRVVLVATLVLTLSGTARAAAPAEIVSDPLMPAPTSVDRLVCALPTPGVTSESAPGTTTITFTLVEPGCA